MSLILGFIKKICKFYDYEQLLEECFGRDFMIKICVERRNKFYDTLQVYQSNPTELMFNNLVENCDAINLLVDDIENKCWNPIMEIHVVKTLQMKSQISS
jgi:hypothetical protein